MQTTFSIQDVLPAIRLACLISMFLFLDMGRSQGQLADTTRIIAEDGWIERIKTNFGVKFSVDNTYETFKVDTEGISAISCSLGSVTVSSTSVSVLHPGSFPATATKKRKGKQNRSGFYFRHSSVTGFSNSVTTRCRGFTSKTLPTTIPAGRPVILTYSFRTSITKASMAMWGTS